ncbi:metallophosphoesterase family protein [Granulosicoccus sp. 3-233]|uniref:metallophosphoesterase family protein n=1 Tax=Granulosicoccus sp. 3-233 TaxID=3417969 RepID=UPI003D32C54A
MNSSEQMAIAVIADAHCHDMDSDYGLKSRALAGRSATLRSWHDSRRSSRVFNESKSALITALEDIRQRGIRHVILLGDYTDDGQAEANRRLRSLLLAYRQEHGMAFYAIPGNHDCYGPHGKHQSTRFVRTPAETVLVSSDPAIAATEADAVLTPAMYCQGTPEALETMADFALFPRDEHLHWETPFGARGEVEARQYTAWSADGQVQRQLIDASYLIEPVPGLWLLMIDANVFEPRNGQRDVTRKKAFHDSSDAGWNAVLRNRPHLLPWIKDVCQRAAAQDKQLLGFSHYPLMDPFDDHSDLEGRLFGQTDMRRRRPSADVASALLDAGLQLHFGGHLHVNGHRSLQREDRHLTDVAVPSSASFPAAYQVIHTGPDSLLLETVPLNDMPLNPDLLDYYRAECRATGMAPDRALSASRYGEFLHQRMSCRVVAHYLPKHWPTELAEAVQTSHAAELATFLLAQRHASRPLHYGTLTTVQSTAAQEALQRLCEQQGLALTELQDCRLLDLISDWYCLRQAGYQACSFFRIEHLQIYRFLIDRFADLGAAGRTTQADFLQVFLGGLGQFLARSIPGQPTTITLDYRQPRQRFSL